jgi:ankyrin repeat protein
VASGANVNATDFSGLTPLRLALGMRNTPLVDFLRQNGGVERVTAAVRSASNSTAAQTLFATNSPPPPRTASQPALTTNVATPSATNVSEAPPPLRPQRPPTERELLPALFPIHEAVRVGDLEQIKFLFQSAPDIVNATDEKGLTPLHVAAAHKQIKAAQTLIGLRAQVNARASNGQTPLHVAVRNADLDIAGLLITNRADVDARDKFQNTPLLLALQSADAEALDAAGGLGAKKTAADVALKLYGLKSQQLQLARLLVSARADVNARNSYGGMPLTEAVRLGNEAVVNLLLDNGANPNVVEAQTKRAPLHVAAMRGHLTVVDALIRHRAQVNAPDGRGETPLCYALREGRTNTVAALRKAGATIGNTRALSATEQSLVDFYQRTEMMLGHASHSEKGKILFGLNPTKTDCERMFPKNAATAWKVVEEINKQIRQAFTKPLPDAEQGKEIWRILPQPPGALTAQWRDRGAFANDLPVYSLSVEKVGASTRPGEYCFVNNHWVLVPPLRTIAAQMAAAEPPRK